MQHWIEAILGYWIDTIGPEGWYRQDDAVDAHILDEFSEPWLDAMDGKCGQWLTSARGALALLVLLDQFPRNMFRGTGSAFASDVHALRAAKVALGKGYDLAVEEPERQFFYLPLMHSEKLPDQEHSVRLILLRMPRTGADNLDHACRHREVIRRFGRFPSRNAALGRTDTDAERAYRADGGYMS